jgi:hypothetical protein
MILGAGPLKRNWNRGASPWLFLFIIRGASPLEENVTRGAFTHSACFTTDRGFSPCTEGRTLILVLEKIPNSSMAEINKTTGRTKLAILEKIMEVKYNPAPYTC